MRSRINSQITKLKTKYAWRFELAVGTVATLLATVPYFLALQLVQTLAELGNFFKGSWPYFLGAAVSLFIVVVLTFTATSRLSRIFLLILIVINIINIGFIGFFLTLGYK